MMRFSLTISAGLLAGSVGFGAVSAWAAPAMPQPGAIAGDAMEQVVHGRHRHLRYTGRTDKAYRAHRRANTHRHGNPNARNPEAPGHQQQLGNTTNGPRY